MHQTDDAIRLELLSLTPLGVDADKVLDFVHTRLYYEGGFASGIGLVRKPGISVLIGHERGGPIGHYAVEALWKFNDRRKLEGIEIRRFIQEGPYSHADDPPVTPKVKIALNQSDEAISQELLKYTPVGSSLADVGRFIMTRLYCESGEANGLPLTGHPGVGVVLGEYVDAKDSLRKVVRVNWRFPEGQMRPELEGIEVKRSSSFDYYNR